MHVISGCVKEPNSIHLVHDSVTYIHLFTPLPTPFESLTKHRSLSFTPYSPPFLTECLSNLAPHRWPSVVQLAGLR
jgi:hypothetical protein